MMLIVGLGNPGVEYSQTRHNIGFAILDAIAAKYRATFNLASKFKADIAQMQTGDQKIILVKPNTYMNLSGQSVSLIKNYYKIDLSDIVVIHDDLDLKFAEVKIKHGGSAAGHRGLISIDGNIGKEYS
ncbi:MAG: aminoacyl-tRNA hydrolase, partial [Rickettsiaceae bacterium]|nr:aminoacyl-tRNA hydrolase [Rickettsiaceae bacterium]